MAVTRPFSAAGTAGSNFSLDIGVAGNNRLVIVCFAHESTSSLVTAVTVDGKSMSELAISPAINTDGLGNAVSFWYIWETTLGSSNGSVTVAATGDTTAIGYSAMTFYSVDETAGINDSNKNDTTVGSPWTVTGIDTPADGLVVALFSHGDTEVYTSFTAPLAGEINGTVSGGVMAMTWGIETSSQTNKSYTGTATGATLRGTGTVVSFTYLPPPTFPDDWGRKVKLTVANAKVAGSTNLSNFPILITHGDLPDEVLDSDGLTKPLANGGDIRFTSDSAGTTQLPFEIVHYTQNATPASATAEIWVKATTLNYSTDTDIYMWWDESAAAGPAADSTYGSEAVWTDYFLVAHDGGETDSSGNYTMTEVGTVTPSTNHLGVSNRANSFSAGVVEYFHTDILSTVDLGNQSVTLQAWANKNNVASMNARMIHLRTLSPSETIMMLANTSDGANFGIAAGGVGPGGKWKSATNSAWHMAHVTSVPSAGVPANGTVYVDGDGTSNNATASSWGEGTADDTVWIGARNDSSTAADYEGDLAEVRIRLSALTADWITTEYNNQSDDGTFWTAGTPEEANPTGPGSRPDTLLPKIVDVATFFRITAAMTGVEDSETARTVTGSGFEASQGTGKLELANILNYATATKTLQTITGWNDTTLTYTVVLPAAGPNNYYVFVTNNSGSRTSFGPIAVHRETSWALAASANIAASGENTTAQLIAPSGKTTGDFNIGRIQDDENPGDVSVGFVDGEYREDEWCISANDAAPNAAQYEFRVSIAGYPISVISVIPKFTISSTLPKAGSDTLLPKIVDASGNALTSAVADSLVLALLESPSFALSAFTRSDTLLPMVDEVATILIALARSDVLSPKIEGIAALFVTLLRSDTLSPKLVELLGNKYKLTPFDYLQLDFPDEDYTYSQVEANREDENLNALFKFPYQAENYGLLIGDFDTFAGSSFGYVKTTASIVQAITQIFGSDTLAPKIVDEVGSLVNMFQRTDAINPKITESVINMLRSTRSDTLTIALAELTVNLLRSSVSDILYPQVLETFAILVQLSRSDDIQLLVESLVSILASFGASDTLFILLEDTMDILSHLSRSDTLLPKVDETLDILSRLARADTIRPKIDETLALLNSFSATDNLYPKIVEVRNILTSLSRSDDIRPRIDEAIASIGTASVQDDLRPKVDSIVTLLVSLLRADELLPRIDTIASMLVSVSGSDTLSPTFVELAEILWYTLEAFRFRNDDGSESTATWLAAQDTTINRATELNTRLRLLFDTNSDAPGLQLKLQYRPVGDPDWEWRDIQ